MSLFKIENNEKTGRTTANLLGLKFSFINKKLSYKPNYSYALSKLKTKYNQNEKIRVGFLVNENSKWNAENLYNLLEANEHFEPIILVTLYNTRHLKKDFTKTSVDDNYKFFASMNKRVLKAYDEKNEKYRDLKNFDIDILFYQQPWGLDESQNIQNVSKYALCCYFAYGISVLDTAVEVRPFHEQLFAYFIPNEETKTLYKKLATNELNNLKIVGYPKLDIYNDLTINKQTKKTIIYAPHHSYNRRLKLGTFHKNGKKILKFAQEHSEFNWIFKPHPDLKETLYKDKKFGKKFCENYYKQWEEIGKIYDKGNYFEHFANSDILITDCDSFLLEYMPTLKPIIRLERKDSTKLSPLGEEIIKGIYRTESFNDLEKLIKRLGSSDEQDFLKEKRKEITSTILRKTNNASKNIVDELEKTFINNEVYSEK